MARAPASYDPFTQQPETMGELERWHHVLAVFQHAGNREPVPLSGAILAPVDRLLAFSVSEYALLLTTGSIRRMIGRYAKDAGVSMAEAETTPLQDAADFLAPRRPARRTKAGGAVRTKQKKDKRSVGPPRAKGGRRPTNSDLLDFDKSERKKTPNLTDKQVLATFRKKHPNHPIFEADDPSGALRAARSRRNQKRPKR